MSKWPIGVFASVDAGLGIAWPVIRELGVPTIHLHAPSAKNRTDEAAQKFAEQLAELNVRCTAVVGGFEGESYADIPTVVRTIGLVPEETREARFAEMCQISDFAKKLGVDCVALHIGFVPEETTDPGYDAIVEVTRRLCDYCEKNEQFLHLETGQETAEGLIKFLDKVDRANLKVNFDPANMIMYGSGEPIEALRMLGPHVRSVHCKDATWSDQPGVTFGREVPLGEGAVNMEAFVKTLAEIGYTGPLTIERETPEDPERQKAEIRSAIDLLTKLRSAHA